ncbi:MAG TPA: hypothetical protein VI893_07365, partial [Thermoplasmata archaeon]|nr:hypothetical protein [Thermoplasmata archaeon]
MARDVTSNGNTGYLLRDDGTVWAWGWNGDEDFGNPTFLGGDSANPVQVTGLSDVVQIQAGYSVAFALTADGTVWSWGARYASAEDLGRPGPPAIASPVIGPTGIRAISVNINTFMALACDGSVWTWGSSTNSVTELPQLVPAIDDAIDVAAGDNGAMVLTSDGSVWSWGGNDYGELGHGSTDYELHAVPAKVPGLVDIVDVASGWNHRLALQSDGTLWTWGRNNHGQLGEGTTIDSALPRQVALGDVAQLPTSYLAHDSGAIGSSGMIWTWGQASPTSDGNAIDLHRPGYVGTAYGFDGVQAGGWAGLILADFVSDGFTSAAEITITLSPEPASIGSDVTVTGTIDFARSGGRPIERARMKLIPYPVVFDPAGKPITVAEIDLGRSLKRVMKFAESIRIATLRPPISLEAYLVVVSADDDQGKLGYGSGILRIDQEPPEVTSIEFNPSQPRTGDIQTSVTAVISDARRGGSKISGAWILIQGDPASGVLEIPMNPQDGEWDSPQETANSTITLSALRAGTYDVRIRTRDSWEHESERITRLTICDGTPLRIFKEVSGPVSSTYAPESCQTDEGHSTGSASFYNPFETWMELHLGSLGGFEGFDGVLGPEWIKRSQGIEFGPRAIWTVSANTQGSHPYSYDCEGRTCVDEIIAFLDFVLRAWSGVRIGELGVGETEAWSSLIEELLP